MIGLLEHLRRRLNQCDYTAEELKCSIDGN